MDFFRAMFGNRNRQGARHDDFLDPRSGFWGDVKDFPSVENFPSGENFPAGENFNQMFEGMFREMLQFHFPEIPNGNHPIFDGPGHPQNPRDHMLKEPDSGAPHSDYPVDEDMTKGFADTFIPPAGDSEKEPDMSSPGANFGGFTYYGHNYDKDLDGSEVDLFAPKTKGVDPSSRPFFSFRSSMSTSIQTYGTEDGTTKREVIKRDSVGNEEGEVTESRNGQVVRVKTWTTKDGKTEVQDSSYDKDCSNCDDSRLPSAITKPSFSRDSEGLMGKMFKWLWKSEDKPREH